MRGSAGSVVVEAPLRGAGGNSTAGADFRIISIETTRLHSAGRSGASRVARLTYAAEESPAGAGSSPVFDP